jgi:enoyl-CoA hydratase
MRSDMLSMSLASKLEGLRQPVIAAVNGFALGGGCELAMACDIRLASEKAKFGLPEVTLGIIPGNGGAQRLSRIAGKAKAMELAHTGRIFGAEEAKEIGLVSYVYPHEELMDKAMELAKTMAANAQISVQQYKWIMRTALDANVKAGCTMEYLADSVCFSTNDKYEGMSAFLEKRDEKHFTFS